MNKQFIAILAVVVLGLFGVLMLTRKEDPKTASSSQGSQSQGSNHTVGAGNKKVTLVEFGDFQCPACKSYFPIVQEIKKSYGDDITFQFRHYPLVQIHPNATIGARAAEAAGKQGKFFEMHDKLFDHQLDWADSDKADELVVGYAKELNLDTDKFKKDLNSDTVKNKVEQDLQSGIKAGVNATPSFFINGYKVTTLPQTIEEFETLLNQPQKSN